MTDKKMKIDDIKNSKSIADESTQKEAIAKLKKAQESAGKRLSKMGNQHEIQMLDKAIDKDGNKTSALVIDTDKEGYIGLFLELGNPYAITHEGEEKEDSVKLVKYINFMSNIDLTVSDNQKAVGFQAISKARSIVSDFFALNLVLALDVDDAMDA